MSLEGRYLCQPTCNSKLPIIRSQFQSNYSKFSEFRDKLHWKSRAQFQTFINEGRLVARAALQASVEVAGTALWLMATAFIMCPESWLHSLGFPREVQSTVEDLPFNRDNLFNQKMNESLYPLKGPLLPRFLYYSTKEELSQTTLHAQRSTKTLQPPERMGTAMKVTEDAAKQTQTPPSFCFQPPDNKFLRKDL